jgi:hypothetical protein
MNSKKIKLKKGTIFQMIKVYKEFESMKEAMPYIISLSNPSKMMTYGYSTSALDCKQGGKLNLVEGSVCHNCYARKGRYVFPSCQKCLNARMDKIKNEPYWVDAMIYVLNNKRINKEPLTLFRWHDSGDLQSMEHFRKIIEIARMTPTIKHWLPTKEVKLMKDFIKTGEKLPKNLNVRVSAFMVNGKPIRLKGMTTSVVVTTDKLGKAKGLDCPVYSDPAHGKTCGTCTACYDKSIKIINYQQH